MNQKRSYAFGVFLAVVLAFVGLLVAFADWGPAGESEAILENEDLHEPLATTTDGEIAGAGGQVGNIRILKSPERAAFTSPMCRQPKAGEEVVEITLSAREPNPACAILAPNQRLKLRNETGEPVTAGFRNLPPDFQTFQEKRIEPGDVETFDVPVDRYLSEGVHLLRVSDKYNVEIVVTDRLSR